MTIPAEASPAHPQDPHYNSFALLIVSIIMFFSAIPNFFISLALSSMFLGASQGFGLVLAMNPLMLPYTLITMLLPVLISLFLVVGPIILGIKNIRARNNPALHSKRLTASILACTGVVPIIGMIPGIIGNIWLFNIYSRIRKQEKLLATQAAKPTVFIQKDPIVSSDDETTRPLA